MVKIKAAPMNLVRSFRRLRTSGKTVPLKAKSRKARQTLMLARKHGCINGNTDVIKKKEPSQGTKRDRSPAQVIVKVVVVDLRSVLESRRIARACRRFVSLPSPPTEKTKYEELIPASHLPPSPPPSLPRRSTSPIQPFTVEKMLPLPDVKRKVNSTKATTSQVKSPDSTVTYAEASKASHRKAYVAKVRARRSLGKDNMQSYSSSIESSGSQDEEEEDFHF